MTRNLADRTYQYFNLKIKFFNEVVKVKEKFEESEEDFYSEKILEESMEDDEINAQEEGFMMGYLG